MPYDITRTELVWPGKYDESGNRRAVDRVTLPFQVIERVNESRATRETKHAKGLTLFDVWQGDDAETFEEGWRNELIWGDNKLVMSSLLDQFAGKVDLIYIDPPFATGANFSFTTEIGDGSVELAKSQSAIEEKAYRDTWGDGLATYLTMMSSRLSLAKDLLSSSGTIYVHVDYRVDSHIRIILDELFGEEAFRNEIVWHYRHMSNVQRDFARKHDILLRYCRGSEFTFNTDAVREPYDEKTLRRYQSDVVFPGGYRAAANPLGKIPDDVWVIPPLRNVSNENTGFPTQKPEELLSKIVLASSNPGDLVGDFFCGSGTTQAVAEKLGRRWIGCDLGRYAVHTTRKRLLGIPDCKPFEVLNLGKYERRYWQVGTFGEDLDEDGVISLYEYIAFILKLYDASPAAGMQHLHGKKGNAFVHVGAVDSPVTIDEIAASIRECVALRVKELHVLGWEWEMGLHEPMADEAAARGVRLSLRQIPREVMEEQVVSAGDVQFFELGYLDVDVKPAGKHSVGARLVNFVIPNPELVPDDVREKITRWSDYVDYWAVDWDFSEDTFMQGWVTYRTRKDRSLDLESDVHSYEVPGEYAVMVKVIDIFGNDTSKILRVRVD